MPTLTRRSKQLDLQENWKFNWQLICPVISQFSIGKKADLIHVGLGSGYARPVACTCLYLGAPVLWLVIALLVIGGNPVRKY